MRIQSHLATWCLTVAVLAIAAGAVASDPPYPAPINIDELRNVLSLSPGAEQMLERNGFVVLDSPGDVLARAYNAANDYDPPYVYITADAMLEIWFEMASEAQRSEEEFGAAPRLAYAVYTLNACRLPVAHTVDGKSALAGAKQILAVATALRNPSRSADPNVAAVVDSIRKHAENVPYPGEDYTQYAVRGYYASNSAMSTYFLQSMWLSRHFCSVEPDTTPINGMDERPSAKRPSRTKSGEAGTEPYDGDGSLQQAIGLAAIIKYGSSPGVKKYQTPRSLFKLVNDFRQSLNGTPNAVSVEQLISALDRCLGPHWSVDAAVSPGGLVKLRDELTRSQYPRTQVATRSVVEGDHFPAQIVSLLPDYVTPDAAFFRIIVNPAIRDRSLPEGLDVAALMGFPTAIPVGPKDAGTYQSALESARKSLAAPGVYNQWFNVLASLASVDPKAPESMRTPAWQTCRMNAALAGWAQLRHTYLLSVSEEDAYLKADYEGFGYVDPNPAFFRRLADVADQEFSLTAEGLTADRQLRIKRFIQTCRLFATYAQAELDGPLNHDQSEDIRKFGGWISENAASEPVVADVATGERQEVLEAGTGMFYPIIVMPQRGGPAYVGWTTSYYQYVNPTGGRLSDESWALMLSGPTLRPHRPDWTDSYMWAASGSE